MQESQQPPRSGSAEEPRAVLQKALRHLACTDEQRAGGILRNSIRATMALAPGPNSSRSRVSSTEVQRMPEEGWQRTELRVTAARPAGLPRVARSPEAPAAPPMHGQPGHFFRTVRHRNTGSGRPDSFGCTFLFAPLPCTDVTLWPHGAAAATMAGRCRSEWRMPQCSSPQLPTTRDPECLSAARPATRACSRNSSSPCCPGLRDCFVCAGSISTAQRRSSRVIQTLKLRRGAAGAVANRGQARPP